MEKLRTPEREIRYLIEECGATRSDLVDLGLSAYTAGKWLDTTSPRPMDPEGAVTVPPAGLGIDTVALVPVSDALARRYLRHDVYVRDAALRGQIRLCATHLGWSDNGRIEAVRPIIRRWRIGSGAAVPKLPLRKGPAAAAEPDVLTAWPGPATLVELGEPLPVGLPLGFKPNPTGGAAAIPAVRHVYLTDLIGAAADGGVFKGISSF
jgi:hypothetical protein